MYMLYASYHYSTAEACNRLTSLDDDPRTIRVTARVAYQSHSPFDAVGQPSTTRRGPSLTRMTTAAAES